MGKIARIGPEHLEAVFPKGKTFHIANAECQDDPVKSFKILNDAGLSRLDAVFVKAR